VERREDEGIEGRSAIGCVEREGEGEKTSCDENKITNENRTKRELD
jgi:hypothetical protein